MQSLQSTQKNTFRLSLSQKFSVLIRNCAPVSVCCPLLYCCTPLKRVHSHVLTPAFKIFVHSKEIPFQSSLLLTAQLWSLSLSSNRKCFRPLTIFVALCWPCSRRSLSSFELDLVVSKCRVWDDCLEKSLSCMNISKMFGLRDYLTVYTEQFDCQ